MTEREIRVGTPWNAPGLQRFNGDHPLPGSLIADYPGYSFDFALSRVGILGMARARQGRLTRRDILAGVEALAAGRRAGEA